MPSSFEVVLLVRTLAVLVTGVWELPKQNPLTQDVASSFIKEW